MGLDSLLQQNMQNAGLAGIDRLASNAMFPQSQMDKTQYATSSQMPTSMELLDSDYDAPTNSYTGMPTKPFAKGGIATLRYNGEEDGSQVQSWDPSSGQVQLQKLSNPNDPFSEATNVGYTIPKDQIKNFAPDTDPETGQPIGSGAYVLNDGSTLRVNANGVVQTATPARNEYTLNQDKYYQPTGENLKWDPSISRLTKNIGGVDVEVPGLFTKGGYQDEQGKLRVDANGVPIPLPPAQFDSGAGKSGLSDAAPYIAAAAMMAATGMPVGFEGMVPASETLLGGFGAAAPTVGVDLGTLGDLGIESLPQNVVADASFNAAPGTSSTMGSLNPALASGAAAGTTAGTAGTTFGGTYGALGGASAPAGITATQTAAGLGAGAATTGGITAQQAMAAKMGLDMLNSGMNSGQTQGSSSGIPSVAAAQTTPTINQFGVTGYSGQIPTSDVKFQPIHLSKIKGVGGDYTFAEGGIANLGSYSDGGQLLKGPGDGMSDNIPAKIGDAQPARLADGEFVIPADVVSHLGNGSTDAGAKQLYAMMDKIRKARTGTKKQGKQINPSKFLL